MDKPYVFISHITQEAQLAEVFKNQIAQDFLGMIDVFVSSDGTSISVGSKWLNDIDAALKNAKVELILCSEDSVKQPWINFEVREESRFQGADSLATATTPNNKRYRDREGRTFARA